jgi:hypothetical protein
MDAFRFQLFQVGQVVTVHVSIPAKDRGQF